MQVHHRCVEYLIALGATHSRDADTVAAQADRQHKAMAVWKKHERHFVREDTPLEERARAFAAGPAAPYVYSCHGWLLTETVLG